MSKFRNEKLSYASIVNTHPNIKEQKGPEGEFVKLSSSFNLKSINRADWNQKYIEKQSPTTTPECSLTEENRTEEKSLSTESETSQVIEESQPTTHLGIDHIYNPLEPNWIRDIQQTQPNPFAIKHKTVAQPISDAENLLRTQLNDIESALYEIQSGEQPANISAECANIQLHEIGNALDDNEIGDDHLSKDVGIVNLPYPYNTGAIPKIPKYNTPVESQDIQSNEIGYTQKSDETGDQLHEAQQQYVSTNIDDKFYNNTMGHQPILMLTRDTEEGNKDNKTLEILIKELNPMTFSAKVRDSLNAINLDYNDTSEDHSSTCASTDSNPTTPSEESSATSDAEISDVSHIFKNPCAHQAADNGNCILGYCDECILCPVCNFDGSSYREIHNNVIKSRDKMENGS